MPTDIGCFGHCDNITTGINAAITGVHTLETYFNGNLVRLTATITAPNEIIFDGSELNESYRYSADVKNTVGTVLNAEKLVFLISPNVTANFL